MMALAAELRQEAETTRKILALVPEDKYAWKPHEKNMTLIQLATHVAEIPSWTQMILNTEVLDFDGNSYTPTVVNNNAELMVYFEKTLAEALAALETAADEKLNGTWTMRNGEKIFFSLPKPVVLRSFVFSHIVHHRAQLGLYLRLLDLKIPGSYGPSADEMNDW